MNADITQQLRNALAQFEAGKFDDTERLLAPLESQLDGHDEYQRLRGMTARARGDIDLAYACFSQAVQINPNNPAHRFNLGEQLAQDHRYHEAVEQLSAGVSLRPQPSLQWVTLAATLEKLNRRSEAATELNRLSDAGAADPLTQKTVVKEAARLGFSSVALLGLRRLLQLRPDDIEAAWQLRQIEAHSVPAWHFPMMNDHPRNAAYRAALQRAITPQTTVLEIGTGSGLLAMMAAQIGARRVTSCEMVASIAEVATEIVKQNGYADRITVVAKSSLEMKVGVDLPQKADLLVSEILSSDVLTENAIAAISHARAELLKPDGKMIPSGAMAVGRLIGGQTAAEAVSVGTVEGFDLSPFNRFTPPALAVEAANMEMDSFSEDIELCGVDFAAPPTLPIDRQITVPVTQSGSCIGVLQWIRVILDKETMHENRPVGRFSAAAWKVHLYTFPNPIEVAAGSSLSLRIRIHTDRMIIAPVL